MAINWEEIDRKNGYKKSDNITSYVTKKQKVDDEIKQKEQQKRDYVNAFAREPSTGMGISPNISALNTETLTNELGFVTRSSKDIEDELSKINKVNTTLKSGIERTRMYGADNPLRAQLAENEKRANELRAQLKEANTAEKNSRMASYSEVLSASDYTEKSKATESKRGKIPFITGDDKYDFINDIGGYRAQVDTASRGAGQNDKYGEYTNLSYMQPEEIGVYNYLYETKGKKEAEQFLDDLSDTLNQRYGHDLAQGRESGVSKVLFGLNTGLDSAAQGMRQLFHEEALPVSATQYAGAEIRENLGGAGQVAYDLVQTTANMAPSILLSTITGGVAGAAGLAAAGTIGSAVGTTAMGLQAAGNAYGEKVRDGYDPDQARTYAALVGASESCLQYFLGGISKLGGRVGGAKLAAKIEAIDNAFGRVALKVGKSMISEGTEEGLQEVLEPIFSTLIFNEEYTPAKIGDIAYSFALGALSAGIMESGEITRGEVNRQKLGHTLRGLGDEAIDMMIGEGLKAEPNSELHNLAVDVQQRMRSGTVTDAQIGSLFEQVSDMRTDESTAQGNTEQQSTAQNVNQAQNTEQQNPAQNVNPVQTEQNTQQTVNPAQETQQERIERANKAATNLERTAILYGVDDATTQRVKRIAEILGRDIAFYIPEDRSENGYNDGKTLYVSAASMNPVAQIIGHELTHSLESTGEYDLLSDLVLSRYQNDGTLNDRIQNKIDLYKRHGHDLTDPEAKQELVAEYIEKNLLTDESSIRDIVTRNRGFGQRILDWIDGILARLGNQDAEERRFLSDVRQKYSDALRAAPMQNVQNNPMQTAQVDQNTQETAQSNQNTTAQPINLRTYAQETAAEAAQTAAPQTAQNTEQTAQPAEQQSTESQPVQPTQNTVPQNAPTQNTVQTEQNANPVQTEPAMQNPVPQNREQNAQTAQPETAETAEPVETIDDIMRKTMDMIEFSISEDESKNNNRITMSDVETLRSIGRKSINTFTTDDIQKAEKWARTYNDMKEKNPFFRAWFGEWRSHDVSPVNVATIPEYNKENVKSQRPNGINKDTGWDISISGQGERNTVAHSGSQKKSVYGLPGTRELIENAILLDTEVHEHHGDDSRNDNVAFDHKLYALGYDGDDIALYKITVEELYHDRLHTNDKRFHNLKYIEKVASVGGRTADFNLPGVSALDINATDYNVSDIYRFVKQYDKDFTPAHEVDPFMLNEDGTPKVFYHGSRKNGGFTVFRDWQYFTERKNYANRYAERENPNSLYEVYLTAEKIFDTRNEDARRIFEDIRQEYGLGEIQDTGLPDWTDGYDITDYLNEHPELEYDAILLDEGGDFVNGEPVSRGFSIVIKNPSQIKSATDNIGTFDRNNPDIRYSISERTPEERNDVNRELKEAQFRIIQQSNPADDEYHTWIRSADEVHTFDEVLADPEWDYDEFDPDYTREMAEEALRSGEIRVYSSHPVSEGVFVTPSAMEAASYSENGNVYSELMQIRDIAWIDPTQGQYAPVEDSNQYSISDPDKRRDMMANLRKYVSGDMSNDEIRRYIGNANGNPVNLRTYAETEADNVTDAARDVVNRAHRMDMDVREYINANWEDFERDGRMNDVGRRALELEQRRYSISNTRNMSWEDQVNGYFNGDGTIKSSDSLYMGVSNVAGTDNAPLYVPTSVINKAIRTKKGSRSAHGLTETDILELENGIKNAPAVIHNPTRNAIIYVTENKDADGNYIVAAFDLNNDLFGENAHKATTIHGRENIATLFEQLNDDATIFVKNENKLNQMLPGNQILKSLELLANVELDENSIAENGANVKRQFSFSEPETDENEPSYRTEPEEEETWDDFMNRVTTPEPEPDMASEPVKSQATYEAQREAVDGYFKLVNDVYDRISPRTNPEDKISNRVNKREKDIPQNASEAWDHFKRKWTDSGTIVAEIGKRVKDKSLYHYYNMARASSNAAVNMITGERTDFMGRKTGEGLNQIMEPIRAKGEDYYKKFQLYLYHMHNIDRMQRRSQENIDRAKAELEEFRMEHPELAKYADFQIEKMARDEWHPNYSEAYDYIKLRDAAQKAENTENKPVFGFDVKAEDSRKITDILRQENPEFVNEAQQVYDYIDNLMQYRVDSGLITEDNVKYLKSIYPHYIPTFRSFETEKGKTRRKNSVQVGSTIKRAAGSSEKLMPIHKALAQQTMSVVREGSKNRFGMRLLHDGTVQGVKDHIRDIRDMPNEFSETDFDKEENELFKKTNTFVVRDKGKLVEMEVSPSLYEAVEALSPDVGEINAAVKIVRAGNNLFKALVTGKNPIFLVRNFVRDLQDVTINSKDLSAFAKEYLPAWHEIVKGGEYWRQYQALGGLTSSIFDFETGETKTGGNIVKRVFDRIETMNMWIEQAPRLAEFMATVKKAEKKGGATMEDIMEAAYNAAEVTTNFGRSGTLGKKLNANWVPFLNPSIQGFSKIVRNVQETKGFKDWTRLITKAIIFGIAPRFISEMLHGDDDEWDAIRDNDKDLYYLFKIRDGLWLKMPKGRVLSVLGMSADRIADLAKGEDVDFREYMDVAIEQIAPSNPFKSNIFTAWLGTELFNPDSPGRTWYGTDIENQRLQNYAPGQRYDTKTDFISKAIGGALNLSPKKINYLLDQYTGVVGDILLPTMSQAAERDPFSNAFTLDTAYSNRYSNDFYSTLDELTYEKNDPASEKSDAVAYRFFNHFSSDVSDVNKLIREIEADDSLGRSEKADLVSAQYMVRNGIMKNALDHLDEYREAAERYYNESDMEDEEDRIDDAYLKANREVFGAEYALKAYNKKTYETAKEMNNAGVSYEDYFDLVFKGKELNEDGKEKKDAEKWADVIDMPYDDDTKITILDDMMNPSQSAKFHVGIDFGITPDTYARVMSMQDEYNADGKGGWTQDEIVEALNSLDLTNEERAILYHLANKTWKPKNNPYDTEIGQKVYDALNE